MAGDRPSQERRDEPEYPKPPDELSGDPILALYPLNGVKRLSPNIDPRPRVVLDTQIWLPSRNGDERSHLLTEELCLIPEESTRQMLWEEFESVQTSGTSRSETRGNILGEFANLLLMLHLRLGGHDSEGSLS